MMSTRNESEPASAQPRREQPFLVATLVFIGLVVAVVGSLGAPLITVVATDYGVSLAAAQWTLTIALLSGAVATPVLSRLGSGPRRRGVVIATLAVVAAGSALTALPVPFAVLLIGRAAQGVGLGLTALMMATARDHLPEERSAATIGLLSVASTAGIGVGYPLAGLLTDWAGIRAAYALGLVVTAAALVATILVMPAAPPRPSSRVDLRGAVVLTAALLPLLLVISQTDLWRRHTAVSAAILAVSLLLLAGWAVLELRTDHPLVDVRALRHPAVAAANLSMLVGGVAMYLLLSLITRYVQTPAVAGYGFGLSTFQSGLVLVPFSLLGFVAGRFMPALRRQLGARAVLAASVGVILVAFLTFAIARDHLAESVVAISVLGLGVGAFSAAMPAVILAATPKAETAGAMGVNQVVRSVGFSIGSALGGLILAAYTSEVFPSESGYTVAAWTGVAITAATLLVVLGFRPTAAR
ncbi:MFS transporter [Prescottella agglutinans]|uniref:MFS family arabinose efflux permease n=1 Tax=Prescottella agglutinans TaxID=1644129 RepID=A0ABT6M6P5_9NOCA|nr:MFS transporter [Prescottella agglutinans]MDH6279977.1 putative MFS family arabinose efflux permease [Prescottella agglutinans]